MSIFSSLAGLASLVGGVATAYTAYNSYQQAKEQSSALRAQNTRNAAIQQENFHKARAENRAALSSSGLAFSGTPLLLMDEDAKKQVEDFEYTQQARRRQEKQASHNTQGQLFGGLAQTATYGSMIS